MVLFSMQSHVQKLITKKLTDFDGNFLQFFFRSAEQSHIKPFTGQLKAKLNTLVILDTGYIDYTVILHCTKQEK